MSTEVLGAKWVCLIVFAILLLTNEPNLTKTTDNSK